MADSLVSAGAGAAAALNPALFPACVAQHSVRFDPADPTELRAHREALEVPGVLVRAVRKRQAEFLAGRFCAREALRRCAAQYADVRVGVGPHHEPLWPRGIVGSITHAHGFASAAVAQASKMRAIGLDVERILAVARAQEIQPHVAAPEELAAVARTTGGNLATALTVIFSAKESVFKCLYPTVQRYFDFCDVWLETFDDGGFSARLLTTLDPALKERHVIEGRYRINGHLVATGVFVSA